MVEMEGRTERKNFNSQQRKRQKISLKALLPMAYKIPLIFTSRNIYGHLFFAFED